MPAGPSPTTTTVLTAGSLRRRGRLARHWDPAAAGAGSGTPSDDLNQLDASHRLVHRYRSATDGNVTLTALVGAKPGRPFTLALGFGSAARAAIGTAQRSAAQPFGRTLER